MRRIITFAFLVFFASASLLLAQGLSLATGRISGTPTPTLDLANRLITLPSEGGTFVIGVTAGSGTVATNPSSETRYDGSFLDRTGHRRIVSGSVFLTEQDFTYGRNPSLTESRETNVVFFLAPTRNTLDLTATNIRVVQEPSTTLPPAVGEGGGRGNPDGRGAFLGMC